MKHVLKLSVLAASFSFAVLSFQSMALAQQGSGSSLPAKATKKVTAVVLPLSESATADYKKTFAAKTGMNADEISQSPIKDFVEVIVGTKVYYMNKPGNWLFDGHLVDMETRTSVTQERMHALEIKAQPKMNWETLILADAIKLTKGQATPGRVLVTFEDPNCGFCKKLAPELEKLENMTIYTFQVSVLGPNSKTKNESIWCSSDRTSAWKTVMKEGVAKGGTECDKTSLDRNTELAQKLHVNGTPTLFFADGSRSVGYLDNIGIEEKLAKIRAK